MARTITFEVVGFESSYDAVLGRPALVQLGAVPNYVVLQLKMSGPHGALIVDGTLPAGTSIDRGPKPSIRCRGSEEPTDDYACRVVREANWPACG